MQKPWSLVRALAVAAAAVAVAVPLLTACNDAPTPKPLEPTSSSGSPTQTSTAEAPTPPAQATKLSGDGAKAFARHLFDVINYAIVTGDSEALRGISLRRCVSCEAIASNIDAIYDSDGRVVTKGWDLQSISPVPTFPLRRPAFDLGVFRNPERIYRSGASRPKTEGNRRQPMTLYLRWADGSWRVARLDLIPT